MDKPIDNDEYGLEFAVAEHLASSTFPHPDMNAEVLFISVGTLRQELERLPGRRISPELIDFILYLLVIDHTKRPTAAEALQHPYLQSDS